MKRSALITIIVLLMSLCLMMPASAAVTPEELKAYDEFLGRPGDLGWTEISAKLDGGGSLTLSEITDMLTDFLKEEGGTGHAVLEDMAVWLDAVRGSADVPYDSWREAVTRSMETLSGYLNPLACVFHRPSVLDRI